MAEEPTAGNPTPDPPGPADRRGFLRAALWGGGIVGLGGIAGLAANKLARRSPASSGTRKPLGEEFTYDVARFQQTDPALILCEESSRFPTGLDRPRNLALATDGRILVCADSGIRAFDAAGKTITDIPLDPPVHSVAVLADASLLAGQEDRILVISPAGETTAVWDAFPDGLLPTTIAASAEGIFVADAKNRAVLHLDESGKTKQVIGRGEFVIPSPYFCARMAPDGLLRVANPGAHTIEAWTLDGSLEISWGKPSFKPAGFCGCCNPVSFDIFPDGSFVTCEKGLPRVKLYDSHGDFLGMVAGPEAFPEYLAAANAGSPESRGSGIYAAVDPNGRIIVLDSVGGDVRTYDHKKKDDG